MRCSRRRADADSNQLSRCQGLESSKQGRNQGPERLDLIRWRRENDDGEGQSVEVLLMLEILVGCHERVETTACQAQQFAVWDARPAHCCHGPNVVLGQQPGESPR